LAAGHDGALSRRDSAPPRSRNDLSDSKQAFIVAGTSTLPFAERGLA
jgi:hypothetical protein